jgi:hypothetical protein
MRIKQAQNVQSFAAQSQVVYVPVRVLLSRRPPRACDAAYTSPIFAGFYLNLERIKNMKKTILVLVLLVLVNSVWADQGDELIEAAENHEERFNSLKCRNYFEKNQETLKNMRGKISEKLFQE